LELCPNAETDTGAQVVLHLSELEVQTLLANGIHITSQLVITQPDLGTECEEELSVQEPLQSNLNQRLEMSEHVQMLASNTQFQWVANPSIGTKTLRNARSG